MLQTPVATVAPIPTGVAAASPDASAGSSSPGSAIYFPFNTATTQSSPPPKTDDGVGDLSVWGVAAVIILAVIAWRKRAR